MFKLLTVRRGGGGIIVKQVYWCQNMSRLIYQKGEISLLWDTQNVVYCKFDLADDRNHVDMKLDPRLACFPQTPGVQFCPHVPFCPNFPYSRGLYLKGRLLGISP